MGEIAAPKLDQPLDTQILHLLIKGVEDLGEDIDDVCADAHFYDAVDAMRSRMMN